MADGFNGKVKILTTCPGCYQGMSRYGDTVGTEAEFLIVEIARLMYGDHWLSAFLSEVKNDGIEHVLV